MKRELSKTTIAVITKFQKDEITATKLYKYLAEKEKNADNKKVLKEMASVEQAHYDSWLAISDTEVKANYPKLLFFMLISSLLGITFAIKYLERGEVKGIKGYRHAASELPEAETMVKDEERHEKMLIALIDEERLRYVASIVLGLNDALVELTGAIAGFTFAFNDTRTIALTAIITGVAATLSMAASNYLAQKADDNSDALKEAIYTGIAYLITVILLVLPYLLIGNKMLALSATLCVVVLIIMFFSYYVHITKTVPFFSRFLEMALICFAVTAISYLIGILAKNFLGLDIAA